MPRSASARVGGASPSNPSIGAWIGRLRVGAGVVALAAALFSLPAHAADRGAERLKEIEEESLLLKAHSEEIRRNFTDRRGLIGVGDAHERYEDAVYQYLVKDYKSAALSFYILVRSQALGNVDLARDAEWYLAESLFELGNYRTAEEAYRYIAEKGSVHPYFADSIRRLLEVYGIVGDVENFNHYYNDFIGDGPGKVSAESISYTLGKSFYRFGEFNRSKSMFDAVPQSSPYYGRARYFLGVLMIRENNYPEAIAEYQKVEALPSQDEDQEKVRQLARLALARLSYEQGQFDAASAWYGKIDEKSPYYSDKLYESLWTYIKRANTTMATIPSAAALDKMKPEERTAADAAIRKARDSARADWGTALQQVSLFLEKYPEHRYAASLQLLQGHLLMKLEAFDDARVAYEKVVGDYTPLIARLDAVSSPEQLRRLLEGVSGGEAAVSERLPPFAMGALLGDDEVARAATAFRTLETQRAELAEAEAIVRDLEAALSGGTNVLGGFLAARQEVSSIRGATLAMRNDLLDAEANWLKTRVPAQYKAEIVQLQKDRASVMTTATAVDATADAGSDRVEVYDEQIREVQSRALRVAELAEKARADAAATATDPRLSDPAQSKLSPQDADKVRSEIVAQEHELDDALAKLKGLQSEVVRQGILKTVDRPVATGNEARRDAVVAKYTDLRRKLQSYRGYVTDSDAAGVYTQVDRLWADVDALEASTEETSRVVNSKEGEEMAAVRARLARESQRVVELRRDLDRDSANAEVVATRAVGGGIRRLEEEFRGDVLTADKGIVDVYWLRKTAASDQMTQLGAEQLRLLRELDEQFRIVRENLDR